MYDEELEDLHHFMLWCPAYDEERGKYDNFQRPCVKNEATIVDEFLFKDGIKNKKKETIYQFWRKKGKEGIEFNQTIGLVIMLFCLISVETAGCAVERARLPTLN